MLITPTLEERMMLNVLVAWLNSQGNAILVRYQDGHTSIPRPPGDLQRALDVFCNTHCQLVVRNEPPAGEHWSMEDEDTDITWYFRNDGSVAATSRVVMCSNAISVVP